MSPTAHAYLAHPLEHWGFSVHLTKRALLLETIGESFSLSLFSFFLSRHLSSKQIPEIKNVIVVNMVSACCKYEADAHVESWAVSPLSIPQWSGRSLQMPLCPHKGTPLPTPPPNTRISQGKCERWDAGGFVTNAWSPLSSGRRETQGDGREALDGFSTSHLVPVVSSIEGNWPHRRRGPLKDLNIFFHLCC